jgi:hypothetical protein
MNYKAVTGSLDPQIPLNGNYFCCTGKTKWRTATAQRLAAMLANDPPEFRTVLGIIADIEGEMPKEGWPVLGPMYFDFDATDDIDESIEGFHNFLANLQGLPLDLHMCRLFASGVKGMHIEIPMECFMAKIPDEGILGLHHVYREVAHSLYVDTLDLRVFSGGKGRQWRVPNRQREGGTYKVPLTVEEALALTPASYAELVSAPRAFPALTPPELCPDLALAYALARDKVMVKASRQRKVTDAARNIKARFGSRLPPVLVALGQGRFPARGGWNIICLQLATLAQSLGMGEGATLDAFKGLIQKHESDGDRYNSPGKRERELLRMFSYVEGSSYQVSIAGIRSILPQGLPCNDFRGL